MSNKIKGFTVVLDRDVSEEYFDRIKEAIEMMRYVDHVEPSLSCADDYIVEFNTKSKLRDKFYGFIKENL